METSLEVRIELLERQLAAARWRARWLAAAAGCIAVALACRGPAPGAERSLRELTIGSVRIDEFGITIVDPIGKTELRPTGVVVSDRTARQTGSLGSGRLELRIKDGASAALDVTADASFGLQTGKHEAALRVSDDHSSLTLTHDDTHSASILASARRAGASALSADASAAITAASDAEVIARKAGRAVRLVADARGARTDAETVEPRPDGAAARDR
ncbi:MAG TPA: hypothetical protein VFT22_23715 [Kofleriaceae bacterium]|nr:hypothetical protein [Kofleriaceae bacterium]